MHHVMSWLLTEPAWIRYSPDIESSANYGDSMACVPLARAYVCAGTPFARGRPVFLRARAREHLAGGAGPSPCVNTLTGFFTIFYSRGQPELHPELQLNHASSKTRT